MSDINADARSGKLIFVSHCILNQSAKVRGIAVFPGSVRPVVDLLLDHGVAIFQMPCPEMTYLGAMRWGQVRDQYDSPMFRRHCQNLADGVMEQALEYRRSGYQVLGFIMVDGSPVCGLKKTPQPAMEGQIWGGMPRYIPGAAFRMWSRRVLRDTAGRGSSPGPGRRSVCEHSRGARRGLVRGCAASDQGAALRRVTCEFTGAPDCLRQRRSG